MIDGNRLVELLGHSSAQASLTRYLTDAGMIERPQGPDVVQYLDFDDLGLALIFTVADVYREEIGEPRDDGHWILSGIHFYNRHQNGQNDKFAGVLPYGLSFDFNRARTVAVLGTPVVDEEDDGYVMNTFQADNDVVVTTSTAVDHGEALWFKVEKIDKFHRERGDV